MKDFIYKEQVKPFITEEEMKTKEVYFYAPYCDDTYEAIPNTGLVKTSLYEIMMMYTELFPTDRPLFWTKN